MGGLGSGRVKRIDTRGIVDTRARLEINWLCRQGYLLPGGVTPICWQRDGHPAGQISLVAEEERVVLVYRVRWMGGEWRDMQQPVRLTWTPCHFGGRRPWFVCPHCGRRVGIIYAADSGSFLCRQCCGLAYASQRESPLERLRRRVKALRRRLRGSEGVFTPFPERPNGMHHQTYSRLLLRGYALEMGYFQAMKETWGTPGTSEGSPG